MKPIIAFLFGSLCAVTKASPTLFDGFIGSYSVGACASSISTPGQPAAAIAASHDDGCKIAVVSVAYGAGHTVVVSEVDAKGQVKTLLTLPLSSVAGMTVSVTGQYPNSVSWQSETVSGQPAIQDDEIQSFTRNQANIDFLSISKKTTSSQNTFGLTRHFTLISK